MESRERNSRGGQLIQRARDDWSASIESRIRDAGKSLIDRFPALSPLLLRAWGTYIYLYVRTTTALTSLRHEASTDPFELLWVDVDRIERSFPPLERSKFKYAGRVIDGDWDRGAEPFEETDLFCAFEAHFERGVEWKQTAFFEDVATKIADGQEMWGCTSRSEFEARCGELDRLYRSIEENGYMTQAQLARSEVDEPIEKQQGSNVVRFVYDEMTVSVARDGEILFNDGRDRLAIVKLLELEVVPVWIMTRHASWQRLRDDVASGVVDPALLPEPLRTHPDLPSGRRGKRAVRAEMT